MNIFYPLPEVRAIHKNLFVGKKIQVRRLSKEMGNPIEANIPFGSSILPFYGHLGASLPKKLLPSYEILDFGLREKANGGRTDRRTYNSYKTFFNDRRKSLCQKLWRGDDNSYIGTPDKAIIWIKTKDFEVELHPVAPQIQAPEEWYSEIFKRKKKFLSPLQTYNTSTQALKSQTPTCDLFGNRFFPVCVFPNQEIDQTTATAIRAVIACATNATMPIVTKQFVFFGLRCKEIELQPVIRGIYKNGGKIVKNQLWDW